MGASTTKTTASAMETASGMKPSATMETATHAAMEAAATVSMETTAPTTMKTAPAPDASRLGEVYVRQPHECARKDPSKCQRNPLAAPRSQHVFLHGSAGCFLSNRRRRATAYWITLVTASSEGFLEATALT